MKYMGSFYATQTAHQLLTLRSKKHLRLTKLQKEYPSYLNMQERKKLCTQINWIDAELQCRKEQMALDLK